MKLNIKMSLITISLFMAVMILSSLIYIALFSSNYTTMLLYNAQGLATSLLSDIEELLSLDLDLDALGNMEEKCKWLVDKNSQTLAYCFVADLSGKILYHNDTGMIGKVLEDDAMARSMAGTSLFHQNYIINKQTYFDITLPIFDNASTHIGLIRLGSPIKIVSDKINHLIITTIIIILVSFAIFSIIISLVSESITKPLKQIAETATHIADGEIDLQAKITGGIEVSTLANAFNRMTTRLIEKNDGIKKTYAILMEIINKAKESIINLNSSTKEIQAATREQTDGANQQASGITEVSATLQELSITAKQITRNVGELVLSSEEILKFVTESENQLMQTVTQLEDVGKISQGNAEGIGELGKKSVIINDMVELIKQVANKTNILSINASIEASRSGEAGERFSVVAGEIRELSRETIESVKEVEKAARDIRTLLNSIIASSGQESEKVTYSGKIVKMIFSNLENISSKIKNNYSFTQKIDVSIKQQENGSVQAADTMRQIAQISMRSAQIARQTQEAIRNIVTLSTELELMVAKTKIENE